MKNANLQYLPCVMWNDPSRLTWRVRSQVSAGMVRNSEKGQIPALLTSTSAIASASETWCSYSPFTYTVERFDTLLNDLQIGVLVTSRLSMISTAAYTFKDV